MNHDEKSSVELLPVSLPDEHQRFYDKLRSKIESFIREKGVNKTIASYVMLAPDLFVLLSRLMMDKRISISSKAIAGMAIAYFISPIDFIPEVVTGAFGYLDDIVVAVFVLRKILVDVDQKVVLEHWSGKEDLLSFITGVIKKADSLIGNSVLRKIEEMISSKARGK